MRSLSGLVKRADCGGHMTFGRWRALQMVTDCLVRERQRSSHWPALETHCAHFHNLRHWNLFLSPNPVTPIDSSNPVTERTRGIREDAHWSTKREL